jgi:hypothetical protein
LEYIIGPKATIFPPHSANVTIDDELIQLCLKCVDGRKMWKDFNWTLQKEIYIEEAQEVVTNDSSTGQH